MGDIIDIISHFIDLLLVDSKDVDAFPPASTREETLERLFQDKMEILRGLGRA